MSTLVVTTGSLFDFESRLDASMWSRSGVGDRRLARAWCNNIDESRRSRGYAGDNPYIRIDVRSHNNDTGSIRTLERLVPTSNSPAVMTKRRDEGWRDFHLEQNVITGVDGHLIDRNFAMGGGVDLAFASQVSDSLLLWTSFRQSDCFSGCVFLYYVWRHASQARPRPSRDRESADMPAFALSAFLFSKSTIAPSLPS